MAATSERLYTLGLRCRPNSPFIQYLALKPHGGAPGEGTALFVSGLPLGTGEEALRELFECFGEVIQAVLHPLKRSGIVVFGSPAGRTATLRFASRGQLLESSRLQQERQAGEEAGEPCGVKAWVHEHKAARPGNDELQRQVDAWMDAYDERVAREAREKQAAMGGDGWTVVVRAKGRKRTREEDGVTVMTGGVAAGAAAAAAAAAAGGAKGQGAQGLGDFYRFQKRERRRSELQELRERFEEDRRRLAQLKAARNFKPY